MRRRYLQRQPIHLHGEVEQRLGMIHVAIYHQKQRHSTELGGIGVDTYEETKHEGGG